MEETRELQAKDKQPQNTAGEATREGPLFRPDVDIFEREDSLVLIADIPGATNDGIELDTKDHTLNISARVTGIDPSWKPVYLEYEIGDYTREFKLGQIVDVGKIHAQVRDGVLNVHLPKQEKALPRKIPVSVDA